MIPVTAGKTVLIMPNNATRTFSIPPAFLELFPEAAHWAITVENDFIKVAPRQAPPPEHYEPPTPEEITAAIAATRAERRNAHQLGFDTQ